MLRPLSMTANSFVTETSFRLVDDFGWAQEGSVRLIF